MTKFVFVGDPNHNGEGPDEIDFQGLHFVKGEPSEDITDKAALAKLGGSTHFVDAAKYETPKPVTKGKGNSSAVRSPVGKTKVTCLP
jgi:hypothetical protein